MRIDKLMFWFNFGGLIAGCSMGDTVIVSAMVVCLNVWMAVDVILKKLEKP